MFKGIGWCVQPSHPSYRLGSKSSTRTIRTSPIKGYTNHSDIIFVLQLCYVLYVWCFEEGINPCKVWTKTPTKGRDIPILDMTLQVDPDFHLVEFGFGIRWLEVDFLEQKPSSRV